MTLYSLDTNACIAHLRSRGSSPVSQRLINTDPQTIVICSVVRTELLYGAYRSVRPFLSVDFDNDAAKECARLRAELMSRNHQIGPYDSLIAAIALVHSHILVTRNMAEFSRIPGLLIENWQ